jgi:hypothetical protein
MEPFKVDLPLSRHNNVAVGVKIRIRPPRDGTYPLEVRIAGHTYLFEGEIDMSPSELEEQNKDFRDKLEDITLRNIDRKNLSHKQLQKEISPLAELGHHLFERVFAKEDIRQVMQGLLTHGDKVSIEIVSERFSIPWELLYPLNPYGDRQPLSYENFWGMRHIVFRLVPQTNISPNALLASLETDPHINVHSLPKVGLLTDRSLKSVEKVEIPHFERLAASKAIDLKLLPPLSANEDERAEFRKYSEWWLNDFNLAHFACHASYEGGLPQKQYIQLTEKFRISLMRMMGDPVKINGRPLIIMNACETGNLNPIYTLHFAREFMRSGARGVVATECPVRDDFAAKFSHELYARLLRSEELGKSVLQTRQHFLFGELRDPAGLTYSMYAVPNIKLQFEEDGTEGGG